ncbi:site-specific integrase [Emticicia sp. BO119]|uniref:site-specific integrase n=1 Tax=Emticicia sp. BO119 TaxID=2757768 RepID=UPI0015F01A01|nr:site-specific integrase [Emticicia sp. BO119]MBA4852404.1 site-specific integrase [Emticicia sp. BO119]
MANISKIQKVNLRTKPTSTNTLSLFLDWYEGNGKRKKEYLGLSILKNPKGVLERQNNKDILAEAEIIRKKRELQVFSGEIDEVLEQKKIKNQNFLDHFKDYLDKYKQADKRVMQAVYKLFQEFAPKDLTAKEVDKKLCLEFKTFLESRLNGESPSSYFARFKKFLEASSDEDSKQQLFKLNPAHKIRNTKKEDSTEKDTLTVEEIKLLIGANCGNTDVRNAFLLACNTGLRFVDIKALKWQNIKTDKIEIIQAKTKKIVEIPLNENARQFLSERQQDNELAFKLPSHNATVKTLEYWAKRAGIEKHITFHCARHTFGTLLAFYKNDIATIGKLMGHTSLKHTIKYVRIADEMKKKAVDSIPLF